MGFARGLIYFVNLCSAITGVVMVGLGIYSVSAGVQTCFDQVSVTIIVFGSILLLMSLLVVYGLTNDKPWMLKTYLILLSLVTVALGSFVIFFVIAIRHSGEAELNAGYTTYDLSSYSKYVRSQVTRTFVWEPMAVCLEDKRPCQVQDDQVFFHADSRSQGSIHDACCHVPMKCTTAADGCCGNSNPNDQTNTCTTNSNDCNYCQSPSNCWLDPDLCTDASTGWVAKARTQTESKQLEELGYCWGCDQCKAATLNVITDNSTTYTFILVSIVVACSILILLTRKVIRNMKLHKFSNYSNDLNEYYYSD